MPTIKKGINVKFVDKNEPTGTTINKYIRQNFCVVSFIVLVNFSLFKIYYFALF